MWDGCVFSVSMESGAEAAQLYHGRIRVIYEEPLHARKKQHHEKTLYEDKTG